MKKLILTAILLLTAFGCVTYVVYANALKVESQPTVTAVKPEPATVETLLKRVNEERAKVGVAPLTLDPMLNQSAQWKADDMVKFDYRSHIKPGETSNNGLDYLDSIDKANVCKIGSENLAWDNSKSTLTTDNAVYWWMQSKLHHDAMLNPNYTITGFGINNWAVVEHFC
jgi:uncharacterized protein YkwD